MSARRSIFPEHFFWGASTASHQVEGGTENQWSVWERANAQQLAKTAPHRLGWLPNWENIKAQATKPENYVSGRGVAHFERYTEDFKLIKKLNLNAFRFSVEWSRLEPEPGRWDEAAIAHYRRYINALIGQGIEPFLNIWHWTLPVWFAELGGFERRANLKYFDRLVAKLAEEYGDSLTYVIILNEPNVYAAHGYVNGEWPPERKNIFTAIRVYRNLASAHRRAYRILKKHKKHMQVGLAAQLANIQAKRPHNFFDQLSTKLMRWAWNWWFLERVRRQTDFTGINYYFTDYYTGLMKRQNPRLPVSDLGWYMEPEGLYPILLRAWARFKKPIFITENGLADAADQYRRWWLEETIVAIERALSEGVDVRGYFHWSLLDNFEWKYGWWPKFGLVAVDRATMRRTIRPSAKWLARRVEELSGAGSPDQKMLSIRDNSF